MIIYAALLWVALGLFDPRGGSALAPRARNHLRIVLALLVVTIFYGALVAGLRAGLMHNTFPLMSGSLVPSDYWYAPLGWLNVFENHSAVQFHHRVLATATLLMILWLWWRLRTGDASLRPRRAVLWLAGALLLQYGLGIVTILRFGQSPPPSSEAVAIGTMHQAGAMVLVTAAVWFAHAARQRRATR
jgi:cytochrome c oxidase assembly protein subunit 15